MPAVRLGKWLFGGLVGSRRGGCFGGPRCGQLLLHAEVEPQHPDEWEQWITATAKAIRHQAIIVDSGPESLGYTAFRLIHTHCRGRHPDRIGVYRAAGADSGVA